jgi:hypothetical protein
MFGSLGTAHEMCEPRVAPLSRALRLIRLDPRGHGHSPLPSGPYSMEELEQGRAIAAAIPGARLELIAHAANLTSVEQAEAVNSLIREHVT